MEETAGWDVSVVLVEFSLVYGLGVAIFHFFPNLEGVLSMARKCDVCGKGAVTGSRIIRRGLEKKKGGIGLHITAVTKRRFRPNLQRLRVKENGRVQRKVVCTQCLRSGSVVKA
jgi:large subunit ribosomal protein L28